MNAQPLAVVGWGYHRQMLQLKEKKDMEDQFKKAQKPWSKLLEKVEKCKANYHIACKNEKTAVNQERNATKDSGMSQDQVRCTLYAVRCTLYAVLGPSYK